MWKQRAFISGTDPKAEFPLSRFLPPFKSGVIGQWAAEFAEPGSIILDPFGISPRMAIELALAGYRVVSVCSNPVTRFVLRMAAADVQAEELVAALAVLAGSRVGEERLEIHLRDLYASSCPECGAGVEVDTFVWQKEPLALLSKQFTCSACGFTGTTEASDQDKARAEKFSQDKLTRARALSKIAPTSDPDRPTAEKALQQYLPRALYALFTTINRFEGLTLPQERRNHLTMLLISALDKCNTLWGYPTTLQRPKQLVTPPVFLERNLWKCLEEGVREWAGSGHSVPVHDLRKSSPLDQDAPGIWVFPGRLKDLKQLPDELKINLIATVFPRPAPAYWTLSAMWGSWLWGREILGGFRSVIRRQRFDWAWHTTAISSTMKELAENESTKSCPMLGIIYENEPSFDLAATLAGDIAGYSVSGLAYSAEKSEVQMVMEPMGESKPQLDRWAEGKIADAGKAFLQENGMPVKYNRLQMAGLLGLAGEYRLSAPDREPAQQYYDLRDLLEVSFSYKQGFVRFGGSEKSNEVGQWWLSNETESKEAITDRLEQKIVNQIIREKSLEDQAVLKFAADQFQGLASPDFEQINAVLNSYGQRNEAQKWEMKPTDNPEARRSDIELIRGLLSHLGRRMGYTIVQGDPFIWMDEQEELDFSFHIIASALIDKIVFNAHFEPDKSVIVLPGSRANLVAYKLAQNPRLQRKVRDGWHFLKFRRVRWLAENPTVNQENFLELINQDPLSFSPPQERLL